MRHASVDVVTAAEGVWRQSQLSTNHKHRLKKEQATNMTRYALRPSASDRRKAKALETKDFFAENEFAAQLIQRFFAVVPTVTMTYSFDIDPEAPPVSSASHTVKALLQTVSSYVSPTVYDQLKTCWNDYHMNGSSKITADSVASLINREARENINYSFGG